MYSSIWNSLIFCATNFLSIIFLLVLIFQFVFLFAWTPARQSLCLSFSSLFSVIVLFGFLVVVFASPEAGLLPGFKTYRSKKLGIEFKYPKILKVRKKDGVVTISHRVPFEHEDPCDRGWPPEKAKEIWDFLWVSLL